MIFTFFVMAFAVGDGILAAEISLCQKINKAVKKIHTEIFGYYLHISHKNLGKYAEKFIRYKHTNYRQTR